MNKLLGVGSLFFVAMISSMGLGPILQEEVGDEMIVGGSLYLLAEKNRRAMAATRTASKAQGQKKEDQSNSCDKKK